MYAFPFWPKVSNVLDRAKRLNLIFNGVKLKTKYFPKGLIKTNAPIYKTLQHQV